MDYTLHPALLLTDKFPYLQLGLPVGYAPGRQFNLY